MVSKVDLYIKRARTEIYISELLHNISNNEILEDFKIPQEETFYSATISHSYYSIFYSTKGLLLTKGIETKAPEVHKKTLLSFKKHFIDNKLLDYKLFLIYKKMIIRAETLLEIFRTEKNKRARYTYNTLPQANKKPSKESINNAKTFFKHSNSYVTNFKKIIGSNNIS